MRRIEGKTAEMVFVVGHHVQMLVDEDKPAGCTQPVLVLWMASGGQAQFAQQLGFQHGFLMGYGKKPG
jgi:hypothetical protein